MNFIAVIDISTFIWDKEHFNINKYSYWELIESKIIMLDVFNRYQVKQLLNYDLITNIWLSFPYSETPDSTKDYQSKLIRYLSKTKFVQYEKLEQHTVVSFPNIVKDFFSDDTRNGVFDLQEEMHTNTTNQFKFFTFGLFWENGQSFTTKIEDDNPKEYPTIVADKSPTIIKDYIDKLRPIFEHNPKHDRIKEGDYESPLSCFDGTNNDGPQKLLESAFEDKGVFYNFDRNNKTWVVFRQHSDRENLYHGYDEKDEQKIPNWIRKKFHKP